MICAHTPWHAMLQERSERCSHEEEDEFNENLTIVHRIATIFEKNSLKKLIPVWTGEIQYN